MGRVLAVLVTAVWLLGCGSGNGEDDGGTAAARAPAATATPTPTTATETPVATPAARRGLRLVEVGSFDAPVHVTAPPGDRRRVFVVEQGGRVRVLRGGRRLDRPFLDISDQVSAGGERGLLSLAFAPDYAESGRFYVYFTDTGGDIRVVEYRRATADTADPGSARQILFQEDSEPNHNGGLLLFGPDDLLYVGIGDGGGAGDQHGPRGNGQDLSTLNGKILRIDPRADGERPYRIPTSNPFVGRDGARPEIFAYGLRNPWRFSIDERSGLVTVGDVGQNEWEEVTVLSRRRANGANFGWRPFEGRERFADGEEAPGHVPPQIVRSHDEGWCSVTAGLVVRDPILADLRGRYVFGDFCEGRIVSARIDGARVRDVRRTSLEVPNLSSFGQDAQRRVYATSLQGSVYRLAPR